MHIHIGYIPKVFANRFCVERTKLSRKVLYHFAIFAVVNKILIIKNCQILVLNNFLLKYYQLYRKTPRDKNHLFSSHRTLRIFSEFFSTAFFYFYQHEKKYDIKKFWKNFQNFIYKKIYIIHIELYIALKI